MPRVSPGMTVAAARALRLAGRWDDALAALDGDDSPEALVERALVLADENLLARDRTEELAAAIDRIEQEDDPALQAFALSRRGLALHGGFLRDRSAGEPPGEMALFERALALRRELGDEHGVAESLFHVGLVHQVVRGDGAASRPFFEESYARAGALGDELLMSYAIRHVAFCDQEDGDLDAAERGFRESLELRERAGWTAGVGAAELALALLHREQGRLDEARVLGARAKAALAAVGADRFLAIAERELADLEA